jgi:hypothetical protein
MSLLFFRTGMATPCYHSFAVSHTLERRSGSFPSRTPDSNELLLLQCSRRVLRAQRKQISTGLTQKQRVRGMGILRGSHYSRTARCRRHAQLSCVAISLLLMAAAADSHFTASSPLPQASAWSAALNVQLDASPSFCSCSPESQQQPNHEPFTYCHWACGTVTPALVAGDQVTVSALQQLGQRFKACAVSLITGEEYLEGAAVMTHSYAAAFNENRALLAFTPLLQVLRGGQPVSSHLFYQQHLAQERPAVAGARCCPPPPPPPSQALLHSQSSRCTLLSAGAFTINATTILPLLQSPALIDASRHISIHWHYFLKLSAWALTVRVRTVHCIQAAQTCTLKSVHTHVSYVRLLVPVTRALSHSTTRCLWIATR